MDIRKDMQRITSLDTLTAISNHGSEAHNISARYWVAQDRSFNKFDFQSVIYYISSFYFLSECYFSKLVNEVLLKSH